jgi:hypothetical protein
LKGILDLFAQSLLSPNHSYTCSLLEGFPQVRSGSFSDHLKETRTKKVGANLEIKIRALPFSFISIVSIHTDTARKNKKKNILPKKTQLPPPYDSPVPRQIPGHSIFQVKSSLPPPISQPKVK